MSTQTGEDNIDVETQTEKVTYSSKWTQFPVTCRSSLKTKEELDLFRMVCEIPIYLNFNILIIINKILTLLGSNWRWWRK